MTTPRQEKAARAFVNTGDMDKAMVAGQYENYPQNKSRLFHNPEWRARVEELIKQRHPYGIKKDLFKDLIEIKERCLQHKEVVIMGIPTGEYTFDAKNAISAIDKLMVFSGMDKGDCDLTDQNEVDKSEFDNLPSDVLEQLQELEEKKLALIESAKQKQAEQ